MTSSAFNSRPWQRWRRRLATLALLLLLLALLAWYERPDGRLRVWFLATEGDAVLIQMPSGAFVLLDGGADPVELPLLLGRRLPFWRRSLDVVVLTALDVQRLPGQVAALQRYRADRVLVPPMPPLTAAQRDIQGAAQAWERLIRQDATPVQRAQPGDRLVYGAAVLTVLDAPASEHASERGGLVMRLDYGTTRVLFGGALASAAAGNQLAAAAPQPVTLLAYPWAHGLPTVSTWQPQAIVFTTAQPAVVQTQQTFYQRARVGGLEMERLYHPGIHGTIQLVSDGQAACVWTERCPGYARLRPVCELHNAVCEDVLGGE